MICYNCHKKLDLPNNKIRFRSYCEYCNADLHVCLNCKYYSPGKPNDCSYPNTEHVSDREKYNFCEEFSPKKSLEQKKDNNEKKTFDSLFKE